MEARYLYIAPTGAQTGPYTASELVQLAGIGGVDLSGTIVEEGSDNRWSVAEIPWLREAVERARDRRSSRDAAVPAAAPAPAPAAPRDIPTFPPTVQPPPDRMSDAEFSPLCNRTTYILLAILPGFLGIVGVHNVVAGFHGRGITQLILSCLALAGVLSILFGAPCCCFFAPLSLGLFVWGVIEAAVITRDAMGRPFR
jgi:hypothetical protein